MFLTCVSSFFSFLFSWISFMRLINSSHFPSAKQISVSNFGTSEEIYVREKLRTSTPVIILYLFLDHEIMKCKPYTSGIRTQKIKETRMLRHFFRCADDYTRSIPSLQTNISLRFPQKTSLFGGREQTNYINQSVKLVLIIHLETY